MQAQGYHAQQSHQQAARYRAFCPDDKDRVNNLPVGMAQHDKAGEKFKTHQYNPHIDPTLQWVRKVEGMMQ